MNIYKQLTLKEYLKQSPPAFVFDHLAKGSKTQRKIVSAELISSLEARLLDEKSFVESFNRLSNEAQRLCTLAYLFGGSGLEYTVRDSTHEALLSSFLVYAVQNKADAKTFYVGFSDCAQRFFSFFSGAVHASTFVRCGLPVRNLSSYRCLNDIVVIFIYALKGGLRKKKDGELLQSVTDEIRNKIHGTIQTGIFEKKDIDSKTIVDCILAYGLAGDYLVQNEKAYSTDTFRIDRWLSKSADEKYLDFCLFIQNYTGQWDMQILDGVQAGAQDAWISVSFFPEHCRSAAVFVLQLLHYIGRMDITLQGRELFWRAAITGDRSCLPFTEQKATILPDFSAIVNQEAGPELLYAFSHVGTITALDQVYKGVINRTTINQSLTNGIKGGDLLGYLTRWGAPENVYETVKEWVREYSRLYVLNADFVVVCDQKTSIQLNTFQPLAGIMEPVEAYQVFRIKNGLSPEVRELLEEMGFDPRVPQQNLSESTCIDPDLAIIIQEPQYQLVFDIEQKQDEQPRPMKTGKYSEELKKLDLSEMHHVIHYAILMGYQVKFEYDGSPYIKKGLYTVTPVALITDKEQILEAKTTGETIKKFYLQRIVMIGVKSV